MVSDEMRAEVERLKREKDAVVLAHYYVTPDAQELADYVGDSFFLSKKAATLDCKTLVFAGVRFMAESAKLLSPKKTVLMSGMNSTFFCGRARTILTAFELVTQTSDQAFISVVELT